MNITIGGRKLITTALLHVPDNEDAWVEFQAETWNVRLNIKFIDNKESSAQSVSLEGKEDHAVLTLRNWNNGLFSAIPKPLELGETNQKKIAFIFSGHAVPGLKRLDISFFWEIENGQ